MATLRPQIYFTLIVFICATQNDVPGPAVSTLPWSLLKMQNLKFHLRTTESAFSQDPQVICMHISVGNLALCNACWITWSRINSEV